jgi:hypothetical protein
VTLRFGLLDAAAFAAASVSALCFTPDEKPEATKTNAEKKIISAMKRPRDVSCRAGELGRLGSFARDLGECTLLWKLCIVNRGRKRGCWRRTVEARESFESIIIVGQTASHGVSNGLSCRVRGYEEVGRPV